MAAGLGALGDGSGTRRRITLSPPDDRAGKRAFPLPRSAPGPRDASCLLSFRKPGCLCARRAGRPRVETQVRRLLERSSSLKRTALFLGLSLAWDFRFTANGPARSPSGYSVHPGVRSQFPAVLGQPGERRHRPAAFDRRAEEVSARPASARHASSYGAVAFMAIFPSRSCSLG
jgi:hypothetical protein